MGALQKGNDDGQSAPPTSSGRQAGYRGTVRNRPDSVPTMFTALLLVALLSTLYFAAESFYDREPTPDLIAAVLLTFLVVALTWMALQIRRSGSE